MLGQSNRFARDEKARYYVINPMKTPLLLVAAGLFGLLLSGCSKQGGIATAPPSPPEKVVTNGWKASWSPDGRQLVYGKGEGAGLERLDLATRQTTPLLAGAKDAAWSPNGRWIAFVREESYNNYLTEQVWVADGEGKNARRLVRGGFPSWSSDGKKLFVHSRQENRILAVDPENPTSQPGVLFSNTPSWYFSVSPDETRIAFGCRGRLEILDRATGNSVGGWPTPRDGGLLPAWSPDAKFIAFGGFDSSQLGLWVLDVTTLKAAQISEGNRTMPAWSRDGAWLAFDSRSGDREVWTVARPYIEAQMRNAMPAPTPEQVAGGTPQPARSADTQSLVGRAAPDFNLPSLDGAPVVLAELKGKVVVVDFWATWCPPCRKSLPHLQRLSQDADLQKKGVKVVAVDLRESKEKVREFLTQNSYSFPVALDGDGATGGKYLVQGIPTTVVIDAAGVIQRVFIGFGDQSEKQLDDAVGRRD
jgi:thiol-disulfide isomerase/thioredoxin